MRKLVGLFVGMISIFAQAQNFDFSPNCKQAYQSVFKLKINDGLTFLSSEKKQNPKNLFPYFIENYVDFFKVYINDNDVQYNQFMSKAEAHLNKLKTGDKSSPYYLYTQAEIYFQQALIKLKFGKYMSAVFDIKKSNELLEKNKTKFPAFLPNQKSLGLLHIIFGNIPDNYKFGASLLGLKGSVNLGVQELKQVLQYENFPFREEALIEYILIQLHVAKNKEAAWQWVADMKLPTDDNLLNSFIAASLASYNGKSDKVLELLAKRPTGKAFMAVPYLDLLYGTTKLSRLDADADVYIKSFLQQNKGRSYQKEANRKLAWFYLVNGKPDLYKKYMQTVLSIKDAPTDEDKAAQHEAESGYMPNAQLLKARILNDGAYYDKALMVLNEIKPEKFTRNKDKIEYLYRRARIYDDMGKTDNAVSFYLQTIDKGKNLDYYYIANACIKLGAIFERQNKNASAKKYYQMALDMDKDEYENSINAEAKAGLNRIDK